MLFSHLLNSKIIFTTSKESDQTSRMRRLVIAFFGYIYHVVGNLMSWLMHKIGHDTEHLVSGTSNN